MFGGIDPKKMQAMMKQMGIAQEEIDALRVIIECEDKDIIIENPSVMKVKMQGQENFQISGDIKEVDKSESEDTTKEDIKTIIEKTGCSEEKAKEALEASDGDLAEAILSLS
ncbi:Nascent polypeptide-associated complex protein [uncultured archaeon]|nr:Nascent polypeptide-associated complex protein [uncultured archaeon]